MVDRSSRSLTFTGKNPLAGKIHMRNVEFEPTNLLRGPRLGRGKTECSDYSYPSDPYASENLGVFCHKILFEHYRTDNNNTINVIGKKFLS